MGWTAVAIVCAIRMYLIIKAARHGDGTDRYEGLRRSTERRVPLEREVGPSAIVSNRRYALRIRRRWRSADAHVHGTP